MTSDKHIPGQLPLYFHPYVFAFPSSEALFEFRFCRNALRSRRLLLKQRTPHCATLKVKRSFT